MRKWSRSEIIGFLSFVVAIVACAAALVVVPEIRAFLGWSQNPPVTSNGESTAVENNSELHNPGANAGSSEGLIAPQMLSQIDAEVVSLEAEESTVAFGKSWAVRHATAKRSPMLVYAWALWLDPAVLDLASIAELQDRYRDIVFIGLDSDSPERWEAARNTSLSHGLTIVYFLKSEDLLRSILRTNNAVPYPTYALIDREGRVVDAFSGSINRDSSQRMRLEKGLANLSYISTPSLAARGGALE